jgi:cysteine desulfuration protein SufE
MNKIEEIQAEVIEEFNMFDDWMEKYEYIIELGKTLPLIDNKHKIDNNLIKGCQSRVWLHADMQNGKIIYSADSDAIITKGIVAILIRVLSNQNAEEIAKANLSFINKLGLKEQLSQTRANGLVSMIKEMKLYALAYQKKMK